MSQPRKPIAKDVETRVLVACRRRCCLCWLLSRDDSEKPGQIAHVDRDHSNPAEDNLAWLCLPHHEQYDRTSRQAKGLTEAELRHARAELLEHLRQPGPTSTAAPPPKSAGPAAAMAFNQPNHHVGQAIYNNGPAHITINSPVITVPSAAKKPAPPRHPEARKPAAQRGDPATPFGSPAPAAPAKLRRTQREPQQFDVFLSHNSQDKPAVRKLKRRLAARELSAWLDLDELQPGVPWQKLLEAGIKSSASVAVLIGKDGLGPWEDEEMQGALRLAVKDQRPIIPVLLPGAPAQPELPMFLGNRTWVDLRDGFTKAGLARLEWGITGQKPERSAGSSVVPAASSDEPRRR